MKYRKSTLGKTVYLEPYQSSLLIKEINDKGDRANFERQHQEILM